MKKTDVNITTREFFFRTLEGQCRSDWRVKVYITFTTVLNIYIYTSSYMYHIYICMWCVCVLGRHEVLVFNSVNTHMAYRWNFNRVAISLYFKLIIIYYMYWYVQIYPPKTCSECSPPYDIADLENHVSPRSFFSYTNRGPSIYKFTFAFLPTLRVRYTFIQLSVIVL